MDEIVPPSIVRSRPMDIPPAITEAAALAELKGIAAKNQVFKSFIGQGYYGTHTPGVILRNILENPAWYTAYTPYQPEISQGRLEALLNFQTMVADLSGLPIANASLLDEATAAAEAMTLMRRGNRAKESSGPGAALLVDVDVLPQTKAVLATRANPLGLRIVEADLFAGEPGEAIENALIAAGADGVFDVVFARQRLVVEVDGHRAHSTPTAFEEDRHKQNRLVNAGYRVLRFTWRDLIDHPDRVLAQIRCALNEDHR